MSLLEHLRNIARTTQEVADVDLTSYGLAQMKRGIGTAAGLAFEPGDYALVDGAGSGGEHAAFSFRTRSFLVIAAKSFVQLPADTPKPTHNLEVQVLRHSADPSDARAPLWIPVADPAEASVASRNFIEGNRLSAADWVGGAVRDAATHSEVGRVAFDGKIWKTGDGAAEDELLYDPQVGETPRI